jgi:hypothetical protein
MKRKYNSDDLGAEGSLIFRKVEFPWPAESNILFSRTLCSMILSSYRGDVRVQDLRVWNYSRKILDNGWCYLNITLNTVHCLRHIWNIRRFGSWLYFHLHIISLSWCWWVCYYFLVDVSNVSHLPEYWTVWWFSEELPCRHNNSK